jgi:cellulose synthase/poly-beta-1,6-N-acetylglucosamine synthase-like glycosyltransferase
MEAVAQASRAALRSVHQPAHRPALKTQGAYPELDCVAHLVRAEALDRAALRAERLGTGADRALIAMGEIDEETYVRALAAALDVGFAPLDDLPRAACPLPDGRLIEAAAAGVAMLTLGDGPVWLIAPRHLAARGLIDLISGGKARPCQFRLTTTARLDRFVLRTAGVAIADHAANGLHARWPLLSACARRGWRAWATLALTLAIAALGLIAAPLAAEATLALFFIAWLALRLTTALMPRPCEGGPNERPDRELPVYTVIAALYREARSVPGLLRSLERLDYPREKLDILLAVEADDRETREAIADYAGQLGLRVIVVPAGPPRTKPRALNAALAFARGHYTVIYDAEDRPEPDQLRRAEAAFAANDDRLACVQARLSIDNTDDGFLARMFTAEYAGQFDVFLDGLCTLGLPLPLGGSSNHFATAALREAGGWDAWNVTEDADLGMRLARFGYRTAMIDSTTYEEAPARLMPWLRQRTRWFKGWMQTWCVHMRQPAALWRELGPRGFIGFQLAVGGNVLAALVHPLFLIGSLVAAFSGAPVWGAGEVILIALYGLSVLTGYASSAILCMIGLSRRQLVHCAWVLLLMPAHWLLLSWAAWRALYQLIVAPYAWEKTEHGLARHSRRAKRLTQALMALEREVAALKAAGLIDAVNRGGRRAPSRPAAQL